MLLNEIVGFSPTGPPVIGGSQAHGGCCSKFDVNLASEQRAHQDLELEVVSEARRLIPRVVPDIAAMSSYWQQKDKCSLRWRGVGLDRIERHVQQPAK